MTRTILEAMFVLPDGRKIPSIGFGTWQIPDGEEAYGSVSAALAAGYRHIDTARAYGNEPSVGRAIADSKIPRDEIFLTTKLPAEIKSYDAAILSFNASLTALGTDYVDLYLIHAPWPWTEVGTDHSAGNAEAWRAMVSIRSTGRARSIGVSNFSVSDLQSLAATSGTKPLVNQILYYIGHTQDSIVHYCKDNGILVEAYSPLASGRILAHPDLQSIASRYGKSVAQVCIRYVVQKGFIPLPKTTRAARMAENAAVDFVISARDMLVLDGLSDGE